MVKPTVLLLLISATLFASMLSLNGSSLDELGSFYYSPVSKDFCRGSSNGECLINEDNNEEFEMESESNRRILFWRRRYISYGALFRNRIPCSRRGASYYNCRPGARANPYTRGCSAITRCRS